MERSLPNTLERWEIRSDIEAMPVQAKVQGETGIHSFTSLPTSWTLGHSLTGTRLDYKAMPKSSDLPYIVSIVLAIQEAPFACAYSPFLLLK